MKRHLALIAVCALLLASNSGCPAEESPIVGIWIISRGVVPVEPTGVQFFADGTGAPYDVHMFPGSPQFTGPFVWYVDGEHVVFREDSVSGTRYFLGTFTSDTSMSGTEIWTSGANLLETLSWTAIKN